MIDKLECPIPLGAPFKPAIAKIRAELRTSHFKTPAIPFKPTKYYQAVVDLRETAGVDALLHVQSRFGKHDDKLELIDAGEKSWDELMTTVSRVYEDNPENLNVRRVDLCCDVPVPISWFVRSLRVQYKRVEYQHGVIELHDATGCSVSFTEIAKRRVETIQLGQRPNPLRIYDKVAEQLARYEVAKRRHEFLAAKLLAGIEPGTPAEIKREEISRARGRARQERPFPKFSDWSGGLMEGQTLTRLERQIQGKMPARLSNVMSLRSNVLDFNPFERVKFVNPDAVLEVSPDDYSPIEWLGGVKMWELLQSGEWSYQQMSKFFRHRNGNGARIEQKFAPFLRAASASPDGREITGEELRERYRESVKRQLAA